MNAPRSLQGSLLPHAWARAPNSFPPGLKLMIEGYFDDSGKQSDSNFVCAAGFLADTSYWTQFVIQWQHMLRRWSISEVHMKDLMTSNRDFSGWNDDKKRKAIAEFVDVIIDNKLIGIGIAVDANFWNKLPRAVTKILGDAQEFCFMRIVKRIKECVISAQDHDLVTVTFDHDKEFCKPRLTRFHHIIERDRWAKERLVSIGFARARAYPQLQAADMLAWETKRWQETILKGARPSFGEKTMFKGPDGIEFVAGEYWDEEEISKQIDTNTGSIKPT